MRRRRRRRPNAFAHSRSTALDARCQSSVRIFIFTHAPRRVVIRPSRAALVRVCVGPPVRHAREYLRIMFPSSGLGWAVLDWGFLV